MCNINKEFNVKLPLFPLLLPFRSPVSIVSVATSLNQYKWTWKFDKLYRVRMAVEAIEVTAKNGEKTNPDKIVDCDFL